MNGNSPLKRVCPNCGESDFEEIASIYIQCNSCKALIDITDDKLHAIRCPLCDSGELTALPSGNLLCVGCNNSFVAGKNEAKLIVE